MAQERRFCVGATYSTEHESTVPNGRIPAGGNRKIHTAAGLPNAGSIATYRVYVSTTTGNEKGSNTVTITRSVDPPSPVPLTP